MSLPVQAVGIPWYNRADYPRILEIMEDAEVLPDTFDQWLQRAEKTREQFLRRGAIVVKAQIEPDAFVAWCRANSRHVDADGRTAFANLVAYQYATKHQH